MPVSPFARDFCVRDYWAVDKRISFLGPTKNKNTQTNNNDKNRIKQQSLLPC